MTPSELQARREALGLSQVQLGKYLGIAQATINRYEHGRRRIPDAVVSQLELLEAATVTLTDRMVEMTEAKQGGERLALITYTDDTRFWEQHPEHEGLPAIVHRVAAARARAELATDGIRVIIVADSDTAR